MTTKYMTKSINKNDPSVWGPEKWKMYHADSLYYPDKASPLMIDRTVGYIRGIPYTLRCDACRIHAIDYITKRDKELNSICSTRLGLFKFFVDFHNSVNERLGKKKMSYDEAYKLYSN